ncbi:MAG: DUF1624 domain-containing protein [Ruminococcaceae bacterium]|nr:DUF1624 domain-containing protein [Oscillospiraceae bacterium]
MILYMLIYFKATFNTKFKTGDNLTSKKRIHTIDEIRGFCVFCMVFFHCFFTYGYMFGNEFAKNLFDFFEHISFLFSATFILICGISCRLSRNNFLRGSKIIGAALCVTLVTLIVMPDMPITFGILHLLGSCVLIYSLVGRFTDKIPVIPGVAVCFLLFIVAYNMPEGRYIGFGDLRLDLPSKLYESDFLMMFGFLPEGKAYSDYFPLIPYIFPFFAGTFIGKFAKEERFPKFMYKARIKPLSVLGRNAFFVYLIHQPLAYGVFYLISLIGGVKL